MVRPLPPFNLRPLKIDTVKRTQMRDRLTEVTEDLKTDQPAEFRSALRAAVTRAKPELRVLKTAKA
jgi:hypothetical protein